MGKRPSGKRLGATYLFAVGVLRPAMLALTRREWEGTGNLDAEILPDGSQRGIIVCPNHISWFDPFVSAHFLYDNGRPPRYLGKESVFRIPFFGRILAGAGQIPVYRETVDAANSVRDAVSAVERGECVVIYPEGTITRDPGLWPMTGKTGAARVALATRAPVIPVAQWGAQDVMRPYVKELRVLPRKTMQVRAGEPVDLSDLYDRAVDTAILQEATRRIIAAITALLELERGETAPAMRYDWKTQRADRADMAPDIERTED